jgi:hypothetical protein
MSNYFETEPISKESLVWHNKWKQLNFLCGN